MSARILKTWDEHMTHLREVLGAFPDSRTGDNLS